MICRYSRNQRVKKQAEPLTRNVIYFNMTSFPSTRCKHLTDVDIEVSKRYFCIYEGGLNIAELAVSLPLATWNLLDFRLVEKNPATTVFVRSALVITTVVRLACSSPYFESYKPNTDWINSIARTISAPTITIALFPSSEQLTCRQRFEHRHCNTIHENFS